MGYLQYLEYSRFSRGTIGMFEIKFEFVNKKITDEVLTLFSWFIFFFTQPLAIRIHFCHHSFTAWRRWRSPLCLLWKVHWVSSRPTSSFFTVHTKEKAAGSKLGKRTVSGPSGFPLAGNQDLHNGGGVHCVNWPIKKLFYWDTNVSLFNLCGTGEGPWRKSGGHRLIYTVLYSVGPLMKTAAPAIAGPTTLHPHVLYHLYLYTVSIVLYG